MDYPTNGQGPSTAAVGAESRFAAQQRQERLGYPVATSSPKVEPGAGSQEMERARLRDALAFSVETRQQLTQALVSLFNVIEGAGILTSPVDQLMPAPPTPPNISEKEAPPESQAAARFRDIRDQVTAGNVNLHDMIGAIARVRQAIDA